MNIEIPSDAEEELVPVKKLRKVQLKVFKLKIRDKDLLAENAYLKAQFKSL
jgi:hypothetical protein